MKKLVMLAVLALGTTAMVNAQTEPAKKAPAKEVKMKKSPKHHKATEATAVKAVKATDANAKK